MDFIKTVGPLNVTVMITGETGTGKDLIARAIHSLSPRKNKTFQAVNCASMPESLLESELFGYEKGAFTGAYSQKQGLIESSNGGTLFLDEIGELPVGPQAKLLRFLEDKKIRRIGGKEEIVIDVRLIAATNKKLGDEIKKGLFREDLFYRFRGFVVELPPLRERSSDLYLLAEYFIEKYNLEENVMDSFKESFHGRKLHLGHTRAPSCASCHNAHDIKTKTDPTSPVFGKNKLETCGKCHKGANEKFVQAITHKKPGPIPHYGEKLLILLTIGVFAFIVLHVLLEVFADIRDSIFRKKEGK